MTKIYVSEEEQLRYENDYLKRKLWDEHKRLFLMLKAYHEKYINSEPKYLDISYLQYKIVKDIICEFELTDECESFFDFYGWQIK